MSTKFIWNELVTPDQESSGTFFSELLGWERYEIDLGSQGTYTLFREDGANVAGMMNPVTDYSKERPPFWSGYIQVDDVDEHAIKAEELGGVVLSPPEDVPNVGRVCMIADPKGAPVCLMTPIRKDKEPTD